MELTVEQISPKLASEIVVEHHYLHRRPRISWAFGLYRNKKLQGVCTFGTPASRHLQIGVYPENPNIVIELNRLWVNDEESYNTESWFVSRCLKQLPAHIVISYADISEGHIGYVYRALSWNYAGWTDMDRKTPRFDYIPQKEEKHTRDAFRKAGGGVKEKVRRKPKVRYWTTTGTPKEKRRLKKECNWPQMDWNTNPPPEENKINGNNTITI